MDLLLPLGLLGLIGIPILILIYIIKPKYSERTISSTYVWKLSLKYRKKKNPFDKLTKSLLLIIQIICIALITLLITEPFYKKDSSFVNEQIYILDASASMNAVSNDKTRYDLAVDKIYDLVKDTPENTPCTIIVANKDPYYLVERETDKNYIKHILESSDCSYETASYSKAIELAYDILKINSSSDVYMFSDHKFESTGFIKLIDVSNNEWNVSINSASFNLVNGYYEFNIDCASFSRSSNLILELELSDVKANDNNDVDFENKLVVQKELSLAKDKSNNNIVIKDLGVYSFSKAKISLKGKNDKVINDSFVYDNEYYLFGGNLEKKKVQIVSSSTTFIESALRSLNRCIITIRNEDTALNKGFDLYIYENVGPFSLPSDGAIWIINPLANKVYSEIGFSTGNSVYLSTGSSDEEKEKRICYASSTSVAQETKIMNNVTTLQDIEVSKYNTVSSINNNLVTVMNSYNGSPLILAGKVELTYVVVLAFDLHYSTLPITLNMPILVSNMLDFSLRNITDKYEYNVKEEVKVNVLPSSTLLKINYMDNISIYETFNKDIYINTLESGVCSITIESNAKSVGHNFFVRIDKEESNFSLIGPTLASSSKPEDSLENVTIKKEGDKQDLSIYFALVLLGLLLIEWGVQYREQY